jgi:methyltransferase family protein
VLNWAIRYFPILRVLNESQAEINSVLEIGSGAVGIGKFLSAPFVGCDIRFEQSPQPPMLPVAATATLLPFRDYSFDRVVVSDVLEHVAPAQRSVVIREALRVTRSMAVFAFPCGEAAFECDRRLAAAYDEDGRQRPSWLQEHLQHPFPGDDLFEQLPSPWKVTVFGNESVEFHSWVMRREMSLFWNRVFSLALRAVPSVVERALRTMDRAPFYRKIVVVQA